MCIPWRTTLLYACEIGRYRFGEVNTRIAAAVQKVRLVMQWWPVQLPSWFWTAMIASLAVTIIDFFAPKGQPISA